MASIVSSQFDADRIDYLLRDSYMTGANYGRFDIDWLLKNIQIEKSTFRHSEGEMVVSIDYKKGLNVLEQYLIGRYFMYTHVYYHRVNRGFEIVVTNIIKRILEKKYDNFMGYNYINDLHSGNISLEDYLKLDDFTVLTWFKDWYEKTQDFILKDLLYHLFTRKPYYEVIYPPMVIWNIVKKKKIMNGFENEDEKEYYFQEDSPKNTAYRTFITWMKCSKKFIFQKWGCHTLSAIEDSIITGAKGVLKKEKILWYKNGKG